MIVLDANTKSLEVLLGGAVTTNQLPFVASYVDLIPFTAAENDGQTSGTTAVTVVAAPSANIQRQVNSLQVYNADTATATVAIRYTNNSTTRTLIKVALAVASQLAYTDAGGWQVLDANGQLLTSAAVPEPGGSDTQVQFNDGGAFGGDSGLTFNKSTDALSVGGDLTIGGVTTLPAGSATAPALTKSGDTNTGIYFSAADTIDITTGGTNRVSVGTDGAASLTSSSAGAAQVFNYTAANGGYTSYQRSGGEKGRIGIVEAAYGNGTGNDNLAVVGVGSLHLETTSGNPISSITTVNATTASAANLYIDAGNYVIRRSTSSARYKTNIEPLKDWRFLLAIEPVEFAERRTGRQFIGLTAENVAAVEPRLAVLDAEGRPDEVAYTHLSAPIIKAIQELHRTLEDASLRIGELTERVRELEAAS